MNKQRLEWPFRNELETDRIDQHLSLKSKCGIKVIVIRLHTPGMGDQLVSIGGGT